MFASSKYQVTDCPELVFKTSKHVSSGRVYSDTTHVRSRTDKSDLAPWRYAHEWRIIKGRSRMRCLLEQRPILLHTLLLYTRQKQIRPRILAPRTAQENLISTPLALATPSAEP